MSNVTAKTSHILIRHRFQVFKACTDIKNCLKAVIYAVVIALGITWYIKQRIIRIL